MESDVPRRESNHVRRCMCVCVGGGVGGAIRLFWTSLLQKLLFGSFMRGAL